ncbi:MAG: DUF421 domain-containing protein [Pyrinomonadaceae bacterium]|nr:DUF421 domain-containing protein [Pyrinomonadaceae bacterium]
MLGNIWESLLWVIGGNEVEQVIPVWQLIVRTILIYGVAILIIRVGKRRFMGGFTTFDILLGFVVGSVLSRAITGAIRFVDMVVIVSVLAAVHWIFAIAGYYAGSFLSKKMKNSARKLVEDGQMIEEAMRKSKLGENDLMQAIRSKGNVDSIEKVKSAYLERDGNITVIPNGSEANIVEIDVKDNVQTVRIKIEHP